MELDENVKSKKKIEEKLNQFFRFKHDEYGLVDTLKTILGINMITILII